MVVQLEVARIGGDVGGRRKVGSWKLIWIEGHGVLFAPLTVGSFPLWFLSTYTPTVLSYFLKTDSGICFILDKWLYVLAMMICILVLLN